MNDRRNTGVDLTRVYDEVPSPSNSNVIDNYCATISPPEFGATQVEYKARQLQFVTKQNPAKQ
jgi:hypothetical protein